MDTTTLIAIVFGGGGLAAFLVALFNGLRDIRGGSRARIRDVMDDLSRNADNAEKRADEAETRTRQVRNEYEERLNNSRRQLNEAENARDLWRMAAARYAMQLMKANIDPIPPFGEGWPQDPGGSTA